MKLVLVFFHLAVNQQHFARFELIDKISPVKPHHPDKSGIISQSNFKNGHFAVGLPVRLLDNAHNANRLVGTDPGNRHRLRQKHPVPRVIFQQVPDRLHAQFPKAVRP